MLHCTLFAIAIVSRHFCNNWMVICYNWSLRYCNYYSLSIATATHRFEFSCSLYSCIIITIWLKLQFIIITNIKSILFWLFLSHSIMLTLSCFIFVSYRLHFQSCWENSTHASRPYNILIDSISIVIDQQLTRESKTSSDICSHVMYERDISYQFVLK